MYYISLGHTVAVTFELLSLEGNNCVVLGVTTDRAEC